MCRKQSEDEGFIMGKPCRIKESHNMDPQPEPVLTGTPAEPVLTGTPGGGSTPENLSTPGSTPDYSPYNSPRPGSETDPAELARDTK